MSYVMEYAKGPFSHCCSFSTLFTKSIINWWNVLWTGMSKESIQMFGLVFADWEIQHRCSSSSKRTAVLFQNTLWNPSSLAKKVISSLLGSAKPPFCQQYWIVIMIFKFQPQSPIATLPFHIKFITMHSVCIPQMKSSGHLKGITGSKTFPRLVITQIRAILSLELLEQISHLNWFLTCSLPKLWSVVRLPFLPLLLLAIGITQLIL